MCREMKKKERNCKNSCISTNEYDSVKIKIQIIAAMGMILPALLPLFCLLLPILLVIVIFSAGVTIQNQNTQSASLSQK